MDYIKQIIKIITILVVIIFATSCGDKSKVNKTTPLRGEEIVVKEEIVEESSKLDNSWVNNIKLNDGNKWEANIETNNGVENMRKLLKGVDPKTTEDYLTLALNLNKEKNILIKECTMKGSSHDNLHVFLLPLIEKIDHLSKVTSIEEGLKTTTSITENLNDYSDYFK